jgi:tetratricopeptide (TPR) repeat protein
LRFQFWRASARRAYRGLASNGDALDQTEMRYFPSQFYKSRGYHEYSVEFRALMTLDPVPMRVILVLAGLLLSAMPAHAQSMSQATTQEQDMDDVRARAAFRLGSQYYDQGQFAEAAAEFERAYGLSGRAQLLYNAYIAYRDARDDANAIRTLRGYLSGVPDAPNHANLEARLAAMERGLEEQREREERVLAEAEQARRDAEDAERRAEQAAQPRVREVEGEVWPWAVLGVGGAMVVAGAITGGVALAQRGQLDSECQMQLCPADFDLAGRRSTIESLAITTDVLLFGGGVLAATGLVLGLVLGPRTEALSEPAPVAMGCSATGCFATVRGEFQ